MNGHSHRSSTIWNTKEPSKHIKREFNKRMNLVPVTPKPKDLVLLTLALGLPTFFFLLGFSAMAYGIPVYKFLATNADYGAGGIGVAIFIGLWVAAAACCCCCCCHRCVCVWCTWLTLLDLTVCGVPCFRQGHVHSRRRVLGRTF